MHLCTADLSRFAATPSRWLALFLITLLALMTLPAAHPQIKLTGTPLALAAFARARNFGNLPLSFIPNVGQTDPAVRFQVHSLGGTAFFTVSEVVVSLPVPSRTGEVEDAASFGEQIRNPLTVVRLRLEGSNPAQEIIGEDRLPGIVNYFIGNNPTEWHTDIPTFGQVRYRGVYPGVDLVFYGTEGKLEYDFVVAPGADPQAIVMSVEGSDNLEVDAAGDLVIQTAGGELRQHKPLIYQKVGGFRERVAGGYMVKNRNQVSFHVGAYDPSRPLVIDPALVYSTYLGGLNAEAGYDIAVDASGAAYVVGYTASRNFPTANPLQGKLRGGNDVFVVKLNPAGNALEFATYLGGSGGDFLDTLGGITLDSSGNAYITGRTNSPDFPATISQLPKSGGYDAFVTKMSATGNALIYSVFIGGRGNDSGGDIAVDADDNAYITGETLSPDFPTASAIQAARGGKADAFIAKLNATGSAVLYSTYLGGKGNEGGFGIAIDASGSAYVTGVTFSKDFPTKNPFQAAREGKSDAFVAKLDPTGSRLVYSSYLGGRGQEQGARIAVDAAGNAYVTGDTTSPDFPIVTLVQPTKNGGSDAFVTRINATGSGIVYSTFLGGSNGEKGFDITLDASGNAYVTGQTFSTDFPTVNPVQATFRGTSDAFVAKLNPTGSTLLFSTYLGGMHDDAVTGIALDTLGDIYVVGFTHSSNFPTVNPVQDKFEGELDVFVAKISESP